MAGLAPVMSGRGGSSPSTVRRSSVRPGPITKNGLIARAAQTIEIGCPVAHVRAAAVLRRIRRRTRAEVPIGLVLRFRDRARDMTPGPASQIVDEGGLQRGRQRRRWRRRNRRRRWRTSGEKRYGQSRSNVFAAHNAPNARPDFRPYPTPHGPASPIGQTHRPAGRPSPRRGARRLPRPSPPRSAAKDRGGQSLRGCSRTGRYSRS